MFCIKRSQIAQVNHGQGHAVRTKLVFILTTMIINVKSLLMEDVKGTIITIKLKLSALELVSRKVIYDNYFQMQLIV